MRKIAILLCGTVLLSQAGCSLFASGTTNVVISSHPEAEIFFDGQRVGKGTARVLAKRDMSHVCEARLDGKTAMLGIGHSLGTNGVLDIIGGFFWLIPFVGLASPGAYKLDQEVVTLHLERTGEVSK